MTNQLRCTLCSTPATRHYGMPVCMGCYNKLKDAAAQEPDDEQARREAGRREGRKDE